MITASKASKKPLSKETEIQMVIDGSVTITAKGSEVFKFEAKNLSSTYKVDGKGLGEIYGEVARQAFKGLKEAGLDESIEKAMKAYPVQK